MQCPYINISGKKALLRLLTSIGKPGNPCSIRTRFLSVRTGSPYAVQDLKCILTALSQNMNTSFTVVRRCSRRVAAPVTIPAHNLLTAGLWSLLPEIILDWLTYHRVVQSSGNWNTMQERRRKDVISGRKLIWNWKTADTTPPRCGTAACTALWCANILMPGLCQRLLPSKTSFSKPLNWISNTSIIHFWRMVY